MTEQVRGGATRNADGKTNDEILWPLELRESPVHEFVEVPIHRHSLYASIEIQRLHTENGSGLIAIVHRVNRVVDVYFEPALKLSRAWRDADASLMHLKSGEVLERNFEESIFAIEDNHLLCNVAFRDFQDNLVQFSVNQNLKGRRRSRSFVPMPASTPRPVLRVLLIDYFNMLTVRDATVEIQVDGQPCAPRKLRLPYNFSRVFAGRYSKPIFLVGVNPSGTYAPQPIQNAVRDVHGNLKNARVGNDENWFQITFSPPLPVIGSLKVGRSTNGRFTVDSPLGIVTRGRFSLTQESDITVELRLSEVRQNWFGRSFMAPGMMVLGSVRWFKRRHSKQSWAGRLTVDGEESQLVSNWEWSN